MTWRENIDFRRRAAEKLYSPCQATRSSKSKLSVVLGDEGRSEVLHYKGWEALTGMGGQERQKSTAPAGLTTAEKILIAAQRPAFLTILD